MKRLPLRTGAGIVLVTGLVFCGDSLGAVPVWLTGTATATAHDKQLAHDLAFDEAKRNAEKAPGCDGPYGGAVETKVAYERIESTGEWSATVTIRETCIVDFQDR